MRKKILVIMLALTMCVGMSACGTGADGNSAGNRDESGTINSERTSEESEVQTESGIQEESETLEAEVQEEPADGECLSEEVKTPNGYINDEGYYVFGWYEQDNRESNGPEPIEWEILDENENGTLLISRYVLDIGRYNEYTSVTWETCSLRSWLNNDFYNAAFDDDMKAKINTVTLINDDNQYFGTSGGNNTNDRIFCLSLSEILKYYSFDSWYSDKMSKDYGFCQTLIIPPTEYANRVSGAGVKYTISKDRYEDYLSEKNYSDDCVGKNGASWWLRTPGASSVDACYVGEEGRAGADEDRWVDNNYIGVRPALYISDKLPWEPETQAENAASEKPAVVEEPEVEGPAIEEPEVEGPAIEGPAIVEGPATE